MSDPQQIEQPGKAEQEEQWYPSDGDLVYAGELVMILKREKGEAPRGLEMLAYLQDKMQISEHRAKIILEEIGLLEIN